MVVSTCLVDNDPDHKPPATGEGLWQNDPMTSHVSSTRIVLGTCHHDCPDSCGWEVTVEDGRATKMRGNPGHPYSQGELCPKVNRFLDRVYSPDRILTPLIVDGPKGSGRYRPASWDEALSLVAERLHDVVDRWGGEAIVPWGDAGTQGAIQMDSLSQRFFARLGSSRQVDSLCGATAGVGTASSLGTPLASDPLDVQYAKYVVLWGTNTRLTNRHLWPYVEKARAEGAKVVVIDPVRTVTADAADWFVQLKPGTDVAFALAVMHVIVRDDLVDHDYVTRHTSGFDELVEHVRDWTPERAAAECGVDADDIERFAREYATTAPAFIRTLIGAEHRENGAQFFRTVSLLPALIGAWKHRGGGYARSVGSYSHDSVDISKFAAPHLSGGRERRPISMNRLGRALLDETLDPPIQAVFVWNGNPVVTAPEASLLRRGLSRPDVFAVVSEQFLTDTARYADVIFPACTQIEQNDVVPAWGHLYVGWNHQAIEPLGESVPNTELWRRLAKAMGFTEPELFATDDELLATCLDGFDVDELKTRGWARVPGTDDLRPFADGFPFPDGRLPFANADLERQGHGRLPTYRRACEGAIAGSGRYPLSLMSPKFHQRFLNASYSHLDGHAGPEGELFCELHPDDATARGITDGDEVTVFNDRAHLRALARVSASARVRPGLVIVPFGWVGDRTRDGLAVNDLTNDTASDWGGGVAFYDTSVEVAPLT